MLTQISGDRVPTLLHRYASLPDEKLDKIEDLADEALRGAVSSSAGPLMAGLAVGLGVAGFSGLPIVGAAAAGYFLYSAVSGALKKGKEAEYIKDVGLLAHALKESDLVRYAEIVGVDAVVNEILQAYQDGQTITAASRKFCIAMGKSPKRRTIDVFMAELKALDAVPDVEKTPLLDGSPPPLAIGPSATNYFNEKTGEGSFILDAVMRSPGVSRLMIGGQRTGKSYLAAVASRELAAKGWKIYHVNLASYGTEDSYYWEHCTRSVVGDLPSITDEAEAKTLLEQAIGCLNDFWAQEQAIMICDEITYVGSRFGQWKKTVDEYLCLVAGRISALTSSGMKREKAIWALCPELVSGSLEGPAKAIKSLDLMLFAVAPGRNVVWNKQEITFNEALYAQVSSNFDNVSRPTAEQVQLCNSYGIDRICFLNGEWLPVGDLPKLEPSVIPDTPAAIARIWNGANMHEVMAMGLVEALIPGTYDPVGALIDEIADNDKRVALQIAYQWAMDRKQSGQEITKSDFLNRAKNERRSDYLKMNRNHIWDELQALL